MFPIEVGLKGTGTSFKMQLEAIVHRLILLHSVDKGVMRQSQRCCLLQLGKPENHSCRKLGRHAQMPEDHTTWKRRAACGTT